MQYTFKYDSIYLKNEKSIFRGQNDKGQDRKMGIMEWQLNLEGAVGNDRNAQYTPLHLHSNPVRFMHGGFGKAKKYNR